MNPGTGTTRYVNFDSGETTIQYGDATLTIPKNSFPQGGPYPVTLSLVSSDGTLKDYGGAIGPIYSIAASVSLWRTVTLKIGITLDPAISPQRVGMAYLDEAAKIWILIVDPESTYDPANNEVSGTVTNFAGKRYFAPVETCPKDGQDGGVCHASLSCKGQACQE